jgi:hypothetical protein
MKYEEALKKPFTDLEKLAMGIILSLIPIVNFTLVQGFAMESSGLGKAKASKKMPEWEDWAYLFMKGLGATIVKFVYALPALVLLGLGVGIAVSRMMSMMAPMLSTQTIEQMMASKIVMSEQIMQVLQQNWYLIAPAMFTAAPLMMLGLLFALLAAFLSPMAVLNYLSKRNFAAAFDFGVVTKKAFTTKYALAWITTLIVGLVLAALLANVPVIGAAIAVFLLSVISYTLYGQAFKETK